MIFVYDHRRFIIKDGVPCVTSVTAAYYRDWMQTFLSHPPISPDVSLSDLDLLPELRERMRGHRFSSLEEVSAAVT
jgi:hypothetical protein